VKAGKNDGALSRDAYLQLDKPSIAEPVHHYAAVAPDLFNAVVDLCVQPGKICMSQMAMLDAKGGVGKEAAKLNVAALTYDKAGRATETPVLPGSVVAQTDRFVKAYCSDNRPMAAPGGETPAPKTLDRLRGAGMHQASGQRVSLAGPLLQPNS
jgi:cytochrome o ubiquinol oxidase subunit 2